MLQSIHDKAKGILGIVIVILIGATFALWGIGDYLGGATEKSAARVDDMEISQSEFDQGLAMQRQRLEKMFQGQVPDSPVFEQQIKNQVLDQLITQRVLHKMAEEEGYRVADQVLAERIKSIEAFQQDGAFAKESYQAIVESQGRSVKEFENLYRGDLTIQQIQDGVMGSAFIGKAELNLMNQIQQQSREIRYLNFGSQQFFADLVITDAELADYYDRNKARYMNPEMVSISYVELKGADLESDIPVDEEAVRRLYDEYVSSLAGREQRKASHILIASSEDDANKKAALDAIASRVTQGESFADLAREVSEDPGSATKGGDLGWVSKGMMVPEFEETLYKLNKGQVSGVVKSSFGYHLIKLDDVKSESVASFESKQAELTAEFKAQLVEDRFYEQSELMATTAYENDQSLLEVADALGLSIKSTESFSRNRGEGVALNEKVRKAAFDSSVISEGRNSEIIEIDKNHALVLRVDQHTEASQKSIDEVKPLIRLALRSEKAKTMAQEAALEALAKVEGGESLGSKSVIGSAKLIESGLIKRDNQSVDPDILQAAFSMQKPVDKPVFKVVTLAMGAALVELSAVKAPEQESVDQSTELASQLTGEQSNREMTAVIEYLKSRSEIYRSEDL